MSARKGYPVVDQQRRRFFGSAAMTLAAARLSNGFCGAQPESNEAGRPLAAKPGEIPPSPR